MKGALETSRSRSPWVSATETGPPLKRCLWGAPCALRSCESSCCTSRIACRAGAFLADRFSLLTRAPRRQLARMSSLLACLQPRPGRRLCFLRYCHLHCG